MFELYYVQIESDQVGRLPTKIHHSKEEATAEAQRLCFQEKCNFFVIKVMEEEVVDKFTYHREPVIDKMKELMKLYPDLNNHNDYLKFGKLRIEINEELRKFN